MINYVFFPLAQILKVNKTNPRDVPDRIRNILFSVLAILVNDWWQAWTEVLNREATHSRIQEQWKIWEQLLLLSASALTDDRESNSSEYRVLKSDETVNSIVALMENLLVPRVITHTNANYSKEGRWEWDGESDLPSMDDYESFIEAVESDDLALQQTEELRQIYPSAKHLRYVTESKSAKGLLAHALTAVLDTARGQSFSNNVRVRSLLVVRVVLVTWTAGLLAHHAQDLDVARHTSVHIQGKPSADSHITKCISPEEAADRCAIFLPGVVSGLIAILSGHQDSNSSQKLQATVVCEAVKTLDSILTVCLSDKGLPQSFFERDTGKNFVKEPHSLDEYLASIKVDDGIELIGSTKEIDTTFTGSSDGSEVVKGDGIRSLQWFENTISHVSIALRAIAPLLEYDGPPVQFALLNLAGRLLLLCRQVWTWQDCVVEEISEKQKEGIGSTMRLLLHWLLNGACSNSNALRNLEMAQSYIVDLITSSQEQKRQVLAFEDEVSSSMRALPRLLTAFGQDEKLKQTCLRLSFLFKLATGRVREDCVAPWVFVPLIVSSSRMERSVLALLGSIVVEENGVSNVDTANVKLKGQEMMTGRYVAEMFKELGAASATLFRQYSKENKVPSETAFGLLKYLMVLGSRWRTTKNDPKQDNTAMVTSLSSLFIVSEMMKGVAEVLDDERLSLAAGKEGSRLRRRAKRFATDITRQVMDIWDEDEEELLEAGPSNKLIQVSKEEALPISIANQSDTVIHEHKHGLSQDYSVQHTEKLRLGPALNIDFVNAASLSMNSSQNNPQTTALQQQVQAVVHARRGDAYLLSVLGSASVILGNDIKLSLLKLLYPIICGVASPSPIVSSPAAQAIEIIAHSAGYASTEACISDHADYILGAASHRLVSTLAHELYAIALRTDPRTTGAIGPKLVPGNEDYGLVYTPLMSAQSAPLVLIEVIRTLGAEALILIEDAIDEVLDAIDKFHLDPLICDGLLSVIERLVEVMLQDVQKSMKAVQSGNKQQHVPGTAPESDFSLFQKWFDNRWNNGSTSDREANVEQGSEKQEDHTNDTTHTQQVIVAMIRKSLPFLSHSSRTIRMRCLRLTNQGIDFLCLQGRFVDALSIVHTLWPILLSRLGFNPSRSLDQFSKSTSTLDHTQLDEVDFYVVIEALKLVGTLAKYLVEYIGTEKILHQALPRMLLFLQIISQEDERSDAQPAKGPITFNLMEDANLSSTLAQPQSGMAYFRKRKFRPFRPFSPLAMFVEQTIDVLNGFTLAMGPSMSENDLYTIATHPTIMTCLDSRQTHSIRERCQHFYFHTLSSLNPALVWLIREAASSASNREDQEVPGSSDAVFPVFLQRPDLDIPS